jgi:23S rRNA (cytidine1920-2'-O)/16S rRNA (cytidine1409-2'-O)-methyltransferase
MRLDQRLVAAGMFESRAKAQAAIAAGLVKVAGRVALKASEWVAEDAVLDAKPAHPWVGRGALKLEHALTVWPIRVAGRAILDIGASTGGFTEVCLSRGARVVYAVDVGHDQLHPRLRADPKVVSLEGVDARRLDRSHVPEPPDLIVCDVSFIGLAKALPAALGLAQPGADLVALIKPQFELGPTAVGRGGLVRDPELRVAAEAGVRDFLNAQGWPALDAVESPITGGDGALERLIWARRS